MAAENEALSITFSEDDLRPSRVSQRAEKRPEKIERRDKIPRTPPRNPKPRTPLPRRISVDSSESPSEREDVERRMRMLEEREREEKTRLERMRKEEEKLKKLREQLEKEEAQRHQRLLEQRSGSGLDSPQDLPTPPETDHPPRVLAPSPTTTVPRPRRGSSRYSRFSDFKYYNWSSDEEEPRRIRARSPSQESVAGHEHVDGLTCDLCALGRKYELRERQKLKKKPGYIDENCRLVEEFAARAN
uniref:Uncharacterized protein n=1 Tax=Steinernema glaseri TaxID=37863 RepID=A0A1I7Y042_9BILA